MLSIFYADRFNESFNYVYQFINEKFGISFANSFVVKAERKIELISKNPFIYKSSVFGENIRVAIITKQTTLFYQVFDDKIILLFLWDNRQKPYFNS